MQNAKCKINFAFCILHFTFYIMNNYHDAFDGAHVLITGGLGFVGSALAHRLVALGAHVTLVDSLIPSYGGNLRNIAGIEDQVKINIADVRDEYSMDYL